MSNESFPVDKFNEALLEVNKVKVRLKPFIAQFQNNNIKWVYEAFNIIHIYLNKPGVNIMYKFNTLNALRVLFDTSDFLLVNWIEVFFLPKITEIALKYVKQPAKQRGKNHFIDQGYTVNDDPAIQKYGYNYIILALQLMQITAQVKPYRLFQIQQTQQPSDFYQAFQLVKKNGYQVPKQLLVYKKPQEIQNQIQKYQNNLKRLSEQEQSEFFQSYEGFCLEKMKQFLNEKQHNQQKNYEISIMKLYESGDLIVSSDALEECKANLIKPSDLTKVKNALIFFHRVMISADYQTFHSLHNEETLVVLFQKIINIPNCDDYSLQRGTNFLSQLKNPKLSKQVYCYFLQCFQKWSIFTTSFLSYENKNDDNNQMKELYQSLIQKLKLEFPPSKNFDSQFKTFKQNIQKNRERNEILIEDIQPKDSQLKKIILQIEKATQQIQKSNKNVQSSKSIKTNEKQSKINIKQPEINQTPLGYQNQSHQFLDKTKKAEEILNRNQINQGKNRQFLKQYSDTLDHELQNLPEDIFNDNFDRALQLKQRITTSLKNQKNLQNDLKKKVQNPNNINIKPINIQELGYNDLKNLDTPVKKINFQDNQLRSSHKPSDSSRKQVQFIPTQSKKILKSQKQIKNNHDLGYDIPSNLQKYPDNKNLGYQKQKQISSVKIKNQVKEDFQKIKSLPNKYHQQFELRQIQGEQKMGQSNRMKKTQYLGNSRKTQKQLNKQRIQNQQSDVKPYRPSEKSIKHTEPILKNQKLEDIALQQQFEQNLSVNKPKQFNSLGRYKLEPHNKIPSKPKIPDQSMYNLRDNFEKIDANLNNKAFGKNKLEPYNKIPSKPRIPDESVNNSRVDFQKSEASLKNSIIDQFSPDQKVRNLSHVSSNQKELQNLGYSQNRMVQNYNQEEQEMLKQLLQDQINVPLCDPMEESFHQIGQLQQKLRQNAVPSFKKCFEADKYIIPQDKNTKLYWLQDATKNLIRTGMSQNKKSRIQSKINVPEILQERNKKYENELRNIQEEKNKKIRQLQSKISNLQNQTVSMKGQIIAQRQQIKTLKANSDFDKQSTGQKGYLMDMENIAVHKLSSPMKFGYGNPRPFDASFYKQSMYLDPTGKLINSKLYKGYFEQFRREKQKKGLLKNKQLLHKDKQIQIGCMVRKESEQIILTFYITPQRDICSLTWRINKNDSLKIQSQPQQSIAYIRSKKQEKIYLTIDIKQIPYYLPEIQFFYEPERQSQQRQIMRSLKLLIPCAFHKFFLVNDISDEIENYFNKKQEIIRGEQVPYSKKILKNLDNIKEYFPTMYLLNKGIQNDKGQITYGGMAYYKDVKIPVKICIKPNQFLYIQANKSLANSNKSESTIEFYICLLTHLLMKDIQ